MSSPNNKNDLPKNKKVILEKALFFIRIAPTVLSIYMFVEILFMLQERQVNQLELEFIELDGLLRKNRISIPMFSLLQVDILEKLEKSRHPLTRNSKLVRAAVQESVIRTVDDWVKWQKLCNFFPDKQDYFKDFINIAETHRIKIDVLNSKLTRLRFVEKSEMGFELKAGDSDSPSDVRSNKTMTFFFTKEDIEQSRRILSTIIEQSRKNRIREEINETTNISNLIMPPLHESQATGNIPIACELVLLSFVIIRGLVPFFQWLKSQIKNKYF